MSKKEALKFILIRSTGNFLVLFAIYGVIATFGPAIMAEAKFRLAQVRGVNFEVSEVSGASKASDVGFAEVLTGSREQVLVAKDTQFSILIPKIGASSKVIPNVDPANEKEFLQSLKHGVAHAKGTVFPGLDGSVYLFAHSADNWWNAGRYNAVFYLLKDLNKGDDVVVFFEDRRYDYQVSNKLILDPTEISLLTSARGGEKKLVLQTCWPPGTTWKRLYVIAVPKS